MLFDYEQLMDYLGKMDEASPRVKLQRIGLTPMGKPMFILFISSEDNIRNLDTLGIGGWRWTTGFRTENGTLSSKRDACFSSPRFRCIPMKSARPRPCP
jgi:hypothetical protein